MWVHDVWKTAARMERPWARLLEGSVPLTTRVQVPEPSPERVSRLPGRSVWEPLWKPWLLKDTHQGTAGLRLRGSCQEMLLPQLLNI